VEMERLAQALERARMRIESGAAAVSGRELARATNPDARYLERVLVREEGKIHVLAQRSIEFIEADGDGIVIVSAGHRFHKAERLKTMEESLDPGRFVRIHRSYLLNLERLSRLELYAKDSWAALLADGTKLPVSRAGYARLKELL